MAERQRGGDEKQIHGSSGEQNLGAVVYKAHPLLGDAETGTKPAVMGEKGEKSNCAKRRAKMEERATSCFKGDRDDLQPMIFLGRSPERLREGGGRKEFTYQEEKG